MSLFDDALMADIRARFCHVERCPYQGARIFFENAGGSLTLKSVVEVSTELAAMPDNQGRDNPASAAMGELIARGREDMATFLGVGDGGDDGESHRHSGDGGDGAGDGDGDGDGDGARSRVMASTPTPCPPTKFSRATTTASRGCRRA